MITISNRIQTYVEWIVTMIKDKKKDKKISDEEWESIQLSAIDSCCASLCPEQKSELLYFYPIEGIMKSSMERYGRPFYLLDADIIKKDSSFVSVCYEGFTDSLVEQVLWSELQLHFLFEQDITLLVK